MLADSADVGRCQGWEMLFKTFNRLVFVGKGFKDRYEFGDHHQVLDLVGQVGDLDRPAFFFQGGLGADDFTQTGGVKVRHFGEIQDKLLFVFLDRSVDRLPELVNSVAEQYFPLEVENGDVALFSLFYLHVFLL
jgi:hypothetical protein